jgi:hypothetical protein
MKPIPQTEATLLLRTDFADEAAWNDLVRAVSAPVGDFRAKVTALSDPAFDGATVEQVLKEASASGHQFVMVADQVTLRRPERPVLVLDVAREPGRSFRVVPSAAWCVENNLSLANMDFEEFIEAADDHGIFRNFPE